MTTEKAISIGTRWTSSTLREVLHQVEKHVLPIQRITVTAIVSPTRTDENLMSMEEYSK
jgi:hypothetical protein